jgi:hypothetical protein
LAQKSSLQLLDLPVPDLLLTLCETLELFLVFLRTYTTRGTSRDLRHILDVLVFVLVIILLLYMRVFINLRRWIYIFLRIRHKK